LQPYWNRRSGRAGALAALWLALAAGAAAGEEPPAPADAPPPVALDRLLKLPPPSPEAPRERLGNATKGEWRARFASARAEREAAQEGLAEVQKKLEKTAAETDSWQVAPPGAAAAGASEAPLSYQLRQELRRQREEVARSERQLQELTIEADLAGVPSAWRE
jgi:hypothetical protein